MCDLLVFAANDITPEHWADFIKTADLTEDIIGKKSPTGDPTPPYTLVHSRSQEDFSRTGEITQKVKTEFKNATYAEMSVLADKISSDVKGVVAGEFMVLDKKSEEDREVILINKSLRIFYTQDKNTEDENEDEIIWRKHRIPFEKAAFFWLAVMTESGNEGDDFLQSTTLKTIDGL